MDPEMKLTHDLIERKSALLIILVLLVVSVGGAVEIIPPQEGASRMSEKIIPSDCVQSGSAVYCRWCGPAHM